MTIDDTRRVWMYAGCAAIAAVAIACGPGRATMPGAIPAGGDAAGSPLLVRVAGRVVRVPLETYVLGAALSEITPVGTTEAATARIYEVQAVIARTYAIAHRRRHAAEGFDLCDDTHCQLYQPGRLRSSSFARVAEAAVTRTRGQVLRLNGPGGAVIDALFHADCGGHTTTPSSAWGGTDRAYLPAREDDIPGVAHRTWTFEATLAEWQALLNSDARTAVGAALTGIEVTATGPGDRVTGLRLSGSRERITTGAVLRTVVTAARGPRAVMSTRFTVHPVPNGVRLSGTGFGHGVGLCQRGATARAARGDGLMAILEHYFPGTRMGR